jgi:hypothetical protein
MDKQQSDHIENRIRQAADEISITFKEEAWKRMEVKLDNEFNKDRRRGFVWWWFSLLLLGIAVSGIYVYNYESLISSKKIADNSSSLHSKPSLNKKTIIKDKNTEGPNLERDTIIQNNQKNNKTILIEEKPANVVNPLLNNRLAKLKQGKINKDNESVTSNEFTEVNKKNDPGKLIVLVNKASTGKLILTRKLKASNENHDRINKLPVKNYNNKQVERSLSNSSIESIAVLNPLHFNISTDNVKTHEPVIQNTSLISPDSISKKNTQVKSDQTSSKGIYFLASVAGEATGIKNISIKETKPVYGIGIGYRFNKRFTVQTGFYFGKKVYAAGANDYKVKPGSYIARFISAQAECYIYDIPLTLRYDVIHKKTSNLYVTSGLSSFILKRETYDMHFFNPSGFYRHVPYTYKHNIDYFSVFNLSLGYEHRLSSALYIQAEPYLKLPLAGLGEGSVKLYSAGLQLGIKYHPLKK